eukprot:75297-Chlamydomonas_euryale.AAC.3
MGCETAPEYCASHFLRISGQLNSWWHRACSDMRSPRWHASFFNSYCRCTRIGGLSDRGAPCRRLVDAAQSMHIVGACTSGARGLRRRRPALEAVSFQLHSLV